MSCFGFHTIEVRADAIHFHNYLHYSQLTLLHQNIKKILRFFIPVFTLLFCGANFAQTNNIALNRPTVALSEEGSGNSAAKATDGNSATRWASNWSDPQWIYVDLGSIYAINRVVLRWEVAYAKAYQIQVSNDTLHWITAYSTTSGNGGTEDIMLNATGRYVRLYATTRATDYGYSLWDFEVFTKTTTSPTALSNPNKALNKPVVASSAESTVWRAEQAVDGDDSTRWASNWNDAQWIYVDLGSSQTISKVVLKWEAAYAREYQIQISNNKLDWITLKTVTDGDGGIDDLTISGTGRYVRMLGIARATAYGYSLWGFEIY